jgi:tetratricopeptide (TPR) repeat protein
MVMVLPTGYAKTETPRLLTNIGWIENELSNFTGALFYYKKALSIDSHHVGALIGIGSILERLGNYSGATMYFKEAIAQPIAITGTAVTKSIVSR